MVRKQASPALKTIFLHIPKTAGTTLHRIIERQYPRAHVYNTYIAELPTYDAIAALKKLPESKRAAILMLKGHMGFGLHQWLPGPATYFTLLRKPVARVVSHYRFILSHPEHYLYDFITDQQMDLETYLETRSSIMMNNAHTRLISGIWDQVGYGECTQAHLDQAKENLRTHFSVVGLTERFDETLILLRRTFGWKNIFYIKHNVSPQRSQKNYLSPAARAIIERDNALDIALYAYARELFEAQVQACGPSFYQELARFQVRNKGINPLLRAYWRIRRYSVRTWLKQHLRRHPL